MVFRAADVCGDYVDDKRSLELTYVHSVLNRLGFDVADLQSLLSRLCRASPDAAPCYPPTHAPCRCTL